MKTFKYILFALLALTAFTLAGCSSDDDYNKGEADDANTAAVYFPSQAAAGDTELDPTDPTKVTITAQRDKTEGAITVPVTITSSEDNYKTAGIFSAGTISFADGQNITTFDVTFPSAEVGTPYTCNIQISDKKYTSLYSSKASGISFTVTRVKWNKLVGAGGETTGKWREDILTTFWILDNLEQDVEIYERADKPGYYRIPNVYSSKFLAALYDDTEAEMSKYRKDAYFFIDATDPDAVWVPNQSLGVNLGLGDITVASWVPDNANALGKNITTKSYYGTNKNGVITFPATALVISMGNYKLRDSNNSALLRIMLPGAKDYDYSLALAATEPANGEVKVSAKLGTDVAKVKYAIFSGSFGDAIAKADAAAIDAGTATSTEITATGVINVTMPASGLYTLVANIYNAAGEMQGYRYVNFGYLISGDEQPVNINVDLIATNEYANQGYTSENSLHFSVNGSDIVSGYYGVFKTSKLASIATNKYAAYVKANGKAFTADNLKAINGKLADTGVYGLSTAITKLTPGTSYTAIVSANNGYITSVTTAVAKTTGTAHPLLGDYALSDMDTLDSKASIFKTWNYYARSISTKTGSPVASDNRVKVGTVTIAENTTDDDAANEVDAIDLTGLSGIASSIGGSDKITFEYYEGLIYSHKGTVIGTYDSSPVSYWMSTTTFRTYSVNYALLGAKVADGYLAFAGNEDYIKNSGLTFNGMRFLAFTDATLGTPKSGLTWFADMVLADPTKDAANPMPTTSSITKADLTKVASLMTTPNNYVELRGDARTRALIREYILKPVNKATNLVIVPELIGKTVKVKTTFTAGETIKPSVTTLGKKFSINKKAELKVK